MVLLKATLPYNMSVCLFNLHSNMVLLKVRQQFLMMRQQLKFTFQYGSIKGWGTTLLEILYTSFTFQYGSIKG